MTLNRENKLIIGMCIAVAILIARLFYIQVIDKEYKQKAEKNSLTYQTIYPNRGIIHDRNGKILVGNRVAYDIMVTPREVVPFDTLEFCRVLGIEPEFVTEKMREYRMYRTQIGWQSKVFVKQISKERYTQFAEIAYKFPGFWAQARSIREYPYNAGGNLLGYVSEVDSDYIEKHEGEYQVGDYAGKTGIEAAREKDLKGIKGYNIMIRDSQNKITSRYKDGELDKIAVAGSNITTTIDAELQNYGQKLMSNKLGSLIAIEPSTGEILTMVSSPCIDVKMLADIGKHYNDIIRNPHKPMFNRSVQASYPPGSVFKLVNGLIGLQEGVFTPSVRYPCDRGYHFGNNVLRCHEHRQPNNFEESIMTSCNAYYCYIFRNLLENKKFGSVAEGLENWKKYVESFGFGKKLGSDFPSELGGFIPDSEYYNKFYDGTWWRAITILSLSIGQGEIGCTPLHLANLAAIIANRGYYYIPHIIKDSEDVKIDPKYKEKQYTMVDPKHFPKVVGGMYKAVNYSREDGATATGAAVKGLQICGKTGTAQNPQGDDHSVFICFAPRDNPKIAVAAYVEHGGYGNAWAAPIASLLTEMYLNGEISEERKELEKKMINSRLLKKRNN